MVVRERNTGYSYFFDDHEAIDGTLYFSKKLLSQASNLDRRLVVILPTLNDLNAIENKKNYKNLKWYIDLKKISSETNSNLFNLADYLAPRDYDDNMVLKCDGHWNAYGNRIAAELVKENFFK